MKRKIVARVMALGLSTVLMTTALAGCRFGIASDPDDPNEEEEEIEEEPVQLRGETKTCPVCKAEVDGDALFCNHCGAQL